jgi:hypothetical protein
MDPTPGFLAVDPLTFESKSSCELCQSDPIFFRYELLASSGAVRGGCCLGCFPKLLRATQWAEKGNS